MKYLALLLFLLSSGLAFSQKYSLSVEVKGISPSSGKVEIALFNKGSDFLKKYYEYRKTIQNVTGAVVKYTFSDLPAGEYAVAIFHDENSDGECNTNFLGIPTEGYGFSNNINHSFSAPTFAECKINVTKNTTASIKVIY